MVNVMVDIVGGTGEVIKDVVNVSIPLQIEMLLMTSYPLTPEHEKEIDIEVMEGLAKYLKSLRDVIGEEFVLDYEIMPLTLQ